MQQIGLPLVFIVPGLAFCFPVTAVSYHYSAVIDFLASKICCFPLVFCSFLSLCPCTLIKMNQNNSKMVWCLKEKQVHVQCSQCPLAWI